MNTEIVYVCNSINNKNIRANELKILRKFEEKLCFEFGETENNIKLRFYKNLEDLNKDYENVEKIKQKLEKEENIEGTDMFLKEEAEEENSIKEYKTKKYYKKGKIF